MAEPFGVDVKLEARDLVREEVHHVFGGWSGLVWLVVVAAGAWILRAGAAGGGGLSADALFVAGAIVLLLAFLLVFYVPFMAWRTYRTSAGLQARTELRFDEEGIHATSSISRGTTSWQAVNRIRESPWAVHLYVGRTARILVPRRALGEDGRQRLLTLAAQHANT